MPAHTTSPYSVLVRDLVHRPGELRERVLDITAPEKLGGELIAVPGDSHVSIALRLESLHDGILATGSVESVAVGECVRCLDSVSPDVLVDFQELFAYSEDEAFDYSVRDDHVDLEPVVRDAVVLSLPFQPVCRAECPGLDPVTGEKLADHPDRPAAEVLDPRWAALQGFQTTENDLASDERAHEAPREKR